MEHQTGQLRAQLFEEFVGRLLAAMYPGITIARNVALADPESNRPISSISVDFLVVASERGEPDVLVETKAPYAGANAITIRKALRHIVEAIHRAESAWSSAKAVLAVSDAVGQASALDIEHSAVSLAFKGVQLEVWDAAKLRELSMGHLEFDPRNFSVEDLSRLIAQPPATVPLAHRPEERMPTGSHDDVIVLSADFCSFSRFVHASGTDTDLVASIMGRFYRETRAVIARTDGRLDKYMGDGILCYWMPGTPVDRFEACVERLVGIAINLAEEWQDHIDFAVEPKGLRAGAAIGSVLFIAEQPGTEEPIHAIGDSINISARLQSEAEPNSLVISNRLRTRHFGNRTDFEELGPRTLKNIGDVIAWLKRFGQKPGA
jgi:class 3 adenylate cyclase